MFSHNELIRTLASCLPESKPNWDSLANKFMQTLRYKREMYNEHTLHHDLARIHLRNSLEELCRNEKVELDPLPAGASAGNYHFNSLYGQTLIWRPKQVQKQVTKRRRGRIWKATETATELFHYTTLDEVLVVDGLPVIVELKLSGTSHRRGKLCKAATALNQRGAEEGARLERLKYILAPVQRYFTESRKISDCGYLLIVYPEMINKDSLTQQKFREAGGLITLWYADRQQYLQEVQQVAEKYQLLPKRPHQALVLPRGRKVVL